MPSSGELDRLVQNKGGQGRISAWRILLPHLSQAAWGCAQTGGLGTGHLGPDSDTAKHRVTLDKSCPSLGSSCSSSMMRRLSISHSLVLDSCDPVDCRPRRSSVMGFPRQEYWSGLPFPSPGDLPNPGIKPGSPALQEDSLPSEPPGKPL